VLVRQPKTENGRKSFKALLQRLRDYGLFLKLEKCEFFKESVEYLGHIIDKNGKRPSDSSIEAIKQLPWPTTVKELQAFLGKINYYCQLISKLSDKAVPLHALLKKKASFVWSNTCERAFQHLKDAVIKATQLQHYDASEPLILATDASEHGVVAVILRE